MDTNNSLNKVRNFSEHIYVQASKDVLQSTNIKKVQKTEKNQKENLNEEYIKNYDIQRYVNILKNMVIPPENKKEIAALLEYELLSATNISLSELKQIIDEVEKAEIESKKEKSSKDF
ncbi:MAG: hypothetical protein NZZ41_03930 [Candidatus Dojkabacteria bacterium]|nr:hypothetical protein [Candidatus Dojkabacteria bacterium]